MTYNIKLTDGTSLVDVEALEGNGPGAQSVPRQILDVIFNNTAFSPAQDSFVVADDLSSRFVAGMQFDITDGPFAATYTVGAGNSIYNPTTKQTTVSISGALSPNPLQIVGVVTGASGVWKVVGALNGSVVYYPSASFTVSGNGAGDGVYFVDSSVTSGTYTIVSVNVGTGVWTVAGDVTEFFDIATTFKVSGATPGAGTYTTSAVILNGGNTEVTVVEPIPLTANSNGSITPWPAVTRITVTGVIPGGATNTGVASVPTSSSFPFAAPPTGLTTVGPNTYSIIWHITGNHANKFGPGAALLVRDNSVFSYQQMTLTPFGLPPPDELVVAIDNGPNTDVHVTFKSDTAPVLPDSTGYIAYPLPPIPYGHVQYDILPVASSLMLVGRGSPAFNNAITWGHALQENDVHLAENFRTVDGLPPPAPLAGQLWYDQLNTSLQLFASTKYTVIGVTTGTGGSWHVAGDVTAVNELQPGKTIIVYNDSGAGPGSAQYTVSTLTLVGTDTHIVVTGTIPSTATGDGTLYSFDDWHGVVTEDLPVQGDIDMNGHSVCNMGIGASVASEYPLTTFSDTCAINTNFADTRYVNATDPLGDSMAGDLNMTNNRVINVASPVGLQDAVNLTYANTNYVNVAGDTMTGDLDMSGNKILDIASPTNGTDAVNKAYVDSLTSGVVWLQGVREPNLFDDSLAGPDVGSAADVADPFTPYNRAFIVKPEQYTITGTSTTPNRWIISGNHAANFGAGQTFVVNGNGAADGTYTVVSAANVLTTTELTVSAFLGATTSSGNVFHARDEWNGLDGHVVVYDSLTTSWKSVLTDVSNAARPVQAGDRFGIFMTPENDDPLAFLPGGSFVGSAGQIYTASSVSTPDYSVTWAAPYTPLEPDALSVVGTHSPHLGHSYTFRGTWGTGGFNVGYKWIQFVGPAMIVDGTGLNYVGNILNVNVGTGLTVSGDNIVIDEPLLDSTYLRLDGTGSAMSANLDVGNNRIVNVASPVNPSDAVTLTYANTNYVNVAGDTMTGDLILNADPTVALGAATKQYVDAVDNAKVNVAGDTMTGDLILNADPTVALGAATKQYVDAVAGSAVTEPATQIVYGTGTGVDSSSALLWDNLTNTMYVGSIAMPGTISAGASTSGDGVTLNIYGSDAFGAANSGGEVRIYGGQSSGAVDGAIVRIKGGTGITGGGGSVTITGGDSVNSYGGGVFINGGTPAGGDGGNIYIAGSSGSGVNSAGGNITLTAGSSTGSGTRGSITLQTQGGISLVADGLLNIQMGASAPATTATNGFPYIPVTNGIPTGVPTAKSGFVPMVVNSNNNRLYIYVNGQWRYAALT